MISQAESGLTTAEYTALQTAINQAHTAPILKVLLEPYAPQWSSRPHFYTASVPEFNAAAGTYNSAGAVLVGMVNPANNQQLIIRALPLEDSGDQSWSTIGTLTETFGVFGLSAAQGVASPGHTIFGHTEVGGAFLYEKQFLNGTLVSSYSDIVQGVGFYPVFLRKTASVDRNFMHVIGTTSKGNWRLGYVDTTAGTNAFVWTWSDIFWPYQVRSFSAIRMPALGYDIIALVTDLPPIADYTVSGTKTIAVEQRVQGIVLFKFDYTRKQWSDFRMIDIADNQMDTVRGTLHLSRHEDKIFMTYAKKYSDTVGLAVSKSANGFDWENPVFYTDIGTKSAVTDCFRMPLVRNGKYIYLIGGEFQADNSGMGVKRSPATAFVGTPDPVTVEDITRYVTGVGGQIGIGRQITLTVSNPGEILTQPNRLLGQAPRSLRARIELGYWGDVSGTQTILLVPALIGDVIGVTEDHSLPAVKLQIPIKDSSALPGLIGVSEATEWPGLALGGDNFAPKTADDTLGASGLGHTALHGGVWTGTAQGLSMECNADEGMAYTTFISRAFLGILTAEVSFYKPINQINMAILGTQPTQVATGTEYAGLCFRIKDNYNFWYVRYKPGKETGAPPPNNTFTFELVKRYGNADSYVDFVAASVTRPVDALYPKYYSGRLMVEWKYNLIRVHRSQPTQAGDIDQILELEAYGMGDTPFATGGEPNTVTIENGATGRPFADGAAGFLGYSALSKWQDIAVNGDLEDGTLTNWVADNNATLQNVTSVPEGRTPHCLKVTTDADSDNSGAHYLITGLSGQGLTLNFKSYIWIESGDDGTVDDAQVEVRVRLFYVGGAKVKSSTTTFKSRNRWEEWSWTVETDQAVNISYAEMWFMDKRAAYLTTVPTVYYVDDVQILKQVVPERIYFGNADFSDGRPLYSAHDALKTLYAFSGHHNVTKRAALEDDFSGTLSKWTVSNASIVSGQAQVIGYILSNDAFPLPLVFEADILSDEGRIGVTNSAVTAYLAELRWSATGIFLMANTGAGDFVRKFDRILGQGRLRFAVTTRQYEGLSFARDKDVANVLDWLSIAVYLNDRLVICGAAPLFVAAASSYKVIFAGLSGVTPLIIDNVFMDELHRHVPFFSVDPGEKVGNGIARIVGASRSVPLARFDGSTLIGRVPIEDPEGVGWTPDWAVPLARGRRSNVQHDYMAPSHFRLVGAWTEKDVFDREGMHNTWRHIFVKKDDPNLMTAPELSTEEAYVLRDMEWVRKKMALTVQYNPLLEHGDTLTYDGEPYQVEGIEPSVAKDENDSVMATMNVTVQGI